jgi:hypothetical protein
VRNGGAISTATYSSGSGGVLSVHADHLLISGDGRIDTAISSEAWGIGPGGAIAISATDTLRLDNAAIRAQTETATGGDIMLAAGRLFDLHNSTVTTSVAGGTGSGGNIFIIPHLVNPPLMVLDNSRIQANAKQGAGGKITIQTGQLIRTPDSVIQASSELGLSGTITIAAPNTDVAGSLVVLPETLFDASSQLRVACAARGGRSASSFNAGGRGGLPPDPGTPLAASPFRQPLEQQTATGSPTTATARPRQAAKPITVSGIPQPVLGSPHLACRR